jgi:hypothetical protein
MDCRERDSSARVSRFTISLRATTRPEHAWINFPSLLRTTRLASRAINHRPMALVASQRPVRERINQRTIHLRMTESLPTTPPRNRFISLLGAAEEANTPPAREPEGRGHWSAGQYLDPSLASRPDLSRTISSINSFVRCTARGSVAVIAERWSQSARLSRMRTLRHVSCPVERQERPVSKSEARDVARPGPTTVGTRDVDL